MTIYLVFKGATDRPKLVATFTSREEAEAQHERLLEDSPELADVLELVEPQPTSHLSDSRRPVG